MYELGRIYWTYLPKGGLIFLNNVTTSKCFILPFASGSYSLHNLKDYQFYKTCQNTFDINDSHGHGLKCLPDKFI